LSLHIANHRVQSVICVIAVILFAESVWPQSGNTKSAEPLNTEQIVTALEHHDREQAKALAHYQAVRHYSIVYHGFSRTLTADMLVEVNYDLATGKNFRILSQSGSGTLCQKVLKRAIDSEKEAAQNKAATALTRANYVFHLLQMDRVDGRPAYVLQVDPITPSKFLYRGRIWVDAADFAVTHMEVQPAKNPSFWISRTLIHHVNQKTNGFWLPERNQSETKVRIGGTAVMTIDYGSYQTVPQAVR
jgi:hypothetical protein